MQLFKARKYERANFTSNSPFSNSYTAPMVAELKYPRSSRMARRFS
jgi:hypothetical protein